MNLSISKISGSRHTVPRHPKRWGLGLCFLASLTLSLGVSSSFAMEVPIYDFPIEAYSQNANDYVSPEKSQYDKPLLSKEYQTSQLQQFYNHYYASDPQGLSPWSEELVKALLPHIKKTEPEVLEEFNNQSKGSNNKHYALNFREQTEKWWQAVKNNMNFEALVAAQYDKSQRAIAVNNTYGRALPDAAPDFYHTSLPGQGFPFDNLQESAIWAGTPLYIVHQSEDKAWSLVVTPDSYFAWVKSSDIAQASSVFISLWQKAAQNQLVAITKTGTSVENSSQQFQFSAYIGAVFPLVKRSSDKTSFYIPVKGSHNRAELALGFTKTTATSTMPLEASPKNLIKVINQLKNRPYGWGGAYFFNDCSQEMKSIFAPFGIWLPRNSSAQSKLGTDDFSDYSVSERISLLKEKGHPLMTLIYIGGHVMLYIGNTEVDGTKTAMTYQNVWGLSPSTHDSRYVIGQSVFLPLVKQYKENPNLLSLAGKTYFKLVYVDTLPEASKGVKAFAKGFEGSQDPAE